MGYFLLNFTTSWNALLSACLTAPQQNLPVLVSCYSDKCHESSRFLCVWLRLAKKHKQMNLVSNNTSQGRCQLVFAGNTFAMVKAFLLPYVNNL